MRDKKLYRDTSDQMIAGVFSGLGEYLGIDKTILRLIYAFITVFTMFFMGIAFYIVAAIIIPKKSDVEKDNVPEAEYKEKGDSIFD